MLLSDVVELDTGAKAAAVLRTPKCWWASDIAHELLVRSWWLKHSAEVLIVGHENDFPQMARSCVR